MTREPSSTFLSAAVDLVGDAAETGALKAALKGTSMSRASKQHVSAVWHLPGGRFSYIERRSVAGGVGYIVEPRG